MKRIGMGLVPSPVDGLTSYLELLNDGPDANPRNPLPRWWIAYGEKPVERDAEGLGWRISPPGIQVRTAAGRLEPDGRISTQTESDPIAKQWADSMTAKYDELAIVEPVFGQLRGCMDLALVTAILASGDLLTHVNLELPMLLDDTRLQLAAHRVPKSVASHASALRIGRTWVVSVSGGVELDVPRVVNAAELQADVGEVRMHDIAESHQLMVVGLNASICVGRLDRNEPNPLALRTHQRTPQRRSLGSECSSSRRTPKRSRQ